MKSKLRFLLAALSVFTSTNLLHSQWLQTNVPNIGPEWVYSFTVSGNKIFAGTGSNGVYLSTNNGSNWISANTGLPSVQITSLVTSGDNIFAGTSHGTFGYGVFLSTNDGINWTPVNSGLPNSASIMSLAVSPGIGGDKIFAGTYQDGIFLSTNNGSNWQNISNGLPPNMPLVFSFAFSGVNIFAGTSSGVFLSTNNGSSWTLSGSFHVRSLAIIGNNMFAGGGTGSGIFLSTDNGSSWTSVNSGLLESYSVWSFANSGNNIFVSGQNDFGGGIYLSTNNGTNWTSTGFGIETPYALTISGNNIFVGTGTWVWRRPLSEMLPSVPQLRFKIITDAGISQPLLAKLWVTDKLIPGRDVFPIIKAVSLNGEVVFGQEDLNAISGFTLWEFSRVELWGTGPERMAHMAFHYGSDNLTNGKSVDAIIYIHDYPTDFYPGWDYYKNADEKMASMLIPPQESFDMINYTRSPLLLVHGVVGSYPTWGEPFVDGLSTDYDAWQFYYPYDQDIPSSGKLLRDALVKLRQDGPISPGQHYNGPVNLVVHSMGGLVARSYIQGGEYVPNSVRKLAMLGTPNHGSYVAYRIYYQHFVDEISQLFGIKFDDQAPAYKQMSPASEFLDSLNSSVLPILSSGLSVDYLVIAGTKDRIPFHEEIRDQDDGVVAVSGASMLGTSIPLATVNLTHAVPLFDKLTIDVPPTVISSFLATSYDPHTVLLDFAIAGFWVSETLNRRSPPSSVLVDRGILNLRIPGIADAMLKIIREDNNKLILRRGFIPDPLRLSEGFYFLQPSGYSSSFFSLNSFGVNDIGFGFPAQPYTLEFQIKDYLFFHTTIKRIPNALSFKHLQTTMATVSLSRGEITAFNAGSSIGTTPIAVNFDHRGSKLFLLKQRYEPLSSVAISEQQYFVDASIDSMTFVINAPESSSTFQQHSMRLTSPTGIVIDSNYANTHPDMEFRQDIGGGIAYYFVKHPQQGMWRVQYNDSSVGNIAAPIATQLNVSVTIAETSYAVNQPIHLEIPLPQPVDYGNITVTSSLYRALGGDTLLLVSGVPLTISGDGTKYLGTITSSTPGLHYIGVVFNCVRNGEQVSRTMLEGINIPAVAAVALLSPLDGENIAALSTTLKWHPSTNALSYRVQVLSSADSLPTIDQSGIIDTSYTAALPLPNQHYYWQVQATNGIDTASWSSMRMFTNNFKIQASTKILLEGAYSSSTGIMNKTLNSSLILTNHFPNLPIPSEAVDSIALEIRTNPDSAGKQILPAWLLSDGTIRDFTDTTRNYVEFDTSAGNYYIVVRHRNHLAIMSAAMQVLNSTVQPAYDFTTAQSQAYGTNPMKLVGTKYCMYAGDANASGIITAADANGVFGVLNSTGYNQNDINLSGIVTASDANIVFGNLNRTSQVNGPTQNPKKLIPEVGKTALPQRKIRREIE